MSTALDYSTLSFKVLYPKKIDFPKATLDNFDSAYVLLIFYSYDFTKESRDHILKFSGKMKEFEDEGCQIIFSSCDSCFSHHAWKNAALDKNGLGLKYSDPFPPMIGDQNKAFSAAFNILDPISGTSIPSGFLLDSNKKILKRIIPMELNPDEVIDYLKKTPLQKTLSESQNIKGALFKKKQEDESHNNNKNTPSNLPSVCCNIS
ncbi:thioredoxin peroxidase-like [Lepeophtheirus salmonis]|uniref:thioredoxin peroxidase-like n=1 Tax=Lepeophtheirus salmonis TaxID=72036 RepID=UPI001AE453E4|nr:thioredoxin peroxidase-like [Lepeophtheirus salmonis]